MFLFTIVVLFVTIIYYIWRRSTFWSRQGIKGPGFFEYLRRFYIPHQDFCLELSAKYGRVFSGFNLWENHLFINDPELISQVLSKQFDKFSDHVTWNLGPSPVANKILFFVPGNKDWKRMHSLLSPAFTAAKLKAMFPKISCICDRLIDIFSENERKGEVVDIRKYIGGLTMDIIASCGYGLETNAINNTEHPFALNSEKMALSMKGPRMILCTLMPNLARLFRVPFFDPDAIIYFTEMAKHLIKERESKPIEGNMSSDPMQIMVDYYDGKGYKKGRYCSPDAYFSFDEIAAQAAFLILAAHETSSDVFCHAMYYLCKHKDYQKKLQEELDSVEEISHDNLVEMKWLSAIINETIRLSPPFLIIPRVCVKDTELSGIKIPAGTTIEIMPYSVQRDPEYWPEPDVFKPERFFGPTNQWALVSFGGGPRACLGKNFGLNELRIGLAKLFHKFEIDLAPGFKLEYHNGLALLTLKSLDLVFKSRK